MRILLATESHGWSGGAAQTLHLARGLKKRGHSVWLACQPSGEIFQRARAEGLALIPVTIRGDADLPAAWKIGRAMAKHGIEICHAQHPKAHAVTLLSAPFLSRRAAFIVTRRVSFPVSVNRFSRWKYTSPYIDRFVAVSEGIRQVLIQGGVNARRIEVIHSGVDPSDFMRAGAGKIRDLRETLNLPENVPTVMKVANFSSWKGQHVLLQAAALLLQRGERAHFVFAGRGTDDLELLAMAESLGIRPACRFLGFRTDVADLLSLAEISVNSAIEGEGLSGALRESLLLGIPVIASDVAGNAELVKADITGKLTPPAEPAPLADAIQWMMAHRQEALAMAERGRAWVLEDFTVDQMVKKTELLYGSLLRTGRHPGG